MKTKFIVVLTVILAITLLLPMGSVSAQQDKGAVTVPTLQAPRLSISLTSPTYKWTKVNGASQYEIQVNRGSTKVIDKIFASSNCSASMCKVTPAVSLDYTAYKWRVRAQISGTWKDWSPYTYFQVSSAFNAQFNGNSNGWTAKSGAWTTGSEYIYATGMGNGYWANFYRNVTTYDNFDFSARVKRSSVSPYESGLAFRMGEAVAANGLWYQGYAFTYKNNQTFSIWSRGPDGSSLGLMFDVPSLAIIPNDWNVLRVIAVGNTFHMYINGTLVANVSDSTSTFGRVGFMMQSSEFSDEFDVDWARLTPLDAAHKFTDTLSPDQYETIDTGTNNSSANPENGE